MSKLQTTYSSDSNRPSLKHKIISFNKFITDQPIILLARPDTSVYIDENSRKIFERNLEKIINLGLHNLEIPWEENPNWLDIMSGLKSKFPQINLGSASNINKKSIDDSIKVNLNFSMMRFWDKELFSYSQANNHLLIPGLTSVTTLKQAFLLNCSIIKIFPVKLKDRNLIFNNYKEVTFIGAGEISISELDQFKNLGFNAIVIGQKAFNGKSFDPTITNWLSLN